MPYYCEPHKKAWERPDQWRGHFTSNHKGEEFVQPEDAFVETVPEGIAIVKKALKQAKQERVEARAEIKAKEEALPKSNDPPGYDSTDPHSLSDEDFLAYILEGIGANPQQVQAIVRGFTVFPAIRDNLTNLQTFIMTNLKPNQKSNVPMVISAMAQRLNQAGPEPGPQYMIDGYGRSGSGYMPPVPMLDQWGRPMPGYQPPPGYAPGRPMYQQDFYEAPRRRRSDDDEDPVLKELKNQNALLAQRLDDEKKEREKEKDQALRDKERAETDTKIAQLTNAVIGLQKSLTEEVSGQKVSADSTAIAALREQLASMQKELADERLGKFMEELGRMGKEKDELVREVAGIKAGAGMPQNGKTTEDIISQAVPFVTNALTDFGGTVKEELAGIRSDLKSLPVSIGTPNLPLPGSGPRVAEAKKIAALSVQEKGFLARANGRPGLG